MKVSEAILAGIPWFEEDQNEQIFSFEDMVYAWNFARTMCFSSTDDYYEQIVNEENGLVGAPSDGEKKYSRKNFKDMVSASFDCYWEKQSKELINNIIESL